MYYICFKVVNTYQNQLQGSTDHGFRLSDVKYDIGCI